MRRFAWLLVVASLVGPAYLALGAGDADASAAYESPYAYEQTFGTAMRLLRVELGCTITEKDMENGYLLFDYKSTESGDRVHHGSLEIVRSRGGAHVTVQLSTLPQYHEQMVVDALAKKLLAEHGAPPPRPKPAPPPPDDGGAGDAESP